MFDQVKILLLNDNSFNVKRTAITIYNKQIFNLKFMRIMQKNNAFTLYIINHENFNRFL